MPRGLPRAVKKCLEKSYDSALLAVEIYNKPAIKFKSGGYIVLMMISWTALFHAIFFKAKKKPFLKKNNRFVKREGDYFYWELERCVAEYFGDDVNNPFRKNLEFFIPLRNMIEHKSLPEIDSDIFAECQALLINYDKVAEKEFGTKYCIREVLSFSLQLYPSSKNLVDAILSNPEAKPAVDFIKSYRSTITTEILNSGEYAFKAFLIQVANHQSKSAMPVQFIAYDKLSEQEKTNVGRVAALVKNRFIQIPVANKDLLKPGAVVRRVQAALGNPKVDRNGRQTDKFNPETHTRCWRKYAVRPATGADNPELTNAEYCHYDQPNNTYLYKEEWVQYLIEQMEIEAEYNSLYE